MFLTSLPFTLRRPRSGCPEGLTSGSIQLFLQVGQVGAVYVADSAVGGWTRYGQGTPSLPTGVGYGGLTLGGSKLPGYVYLVAEDGKAYVCDNAVRGWVRYGQGTPYLPTAGGHSSVSGAAHILSSKRWTHHAKESHIRLGFFFLARKQASMTNDVINNVWAYILPLEMDSENMPYPTTLSMMSGMRAPTMTSL